nr:ribonuclease H-like domain-containing protein [Tanacetum cinerariifolium]
DIGCSRHITGNISYLSEYEPYDGGYVSFGHEGGKITGKGIIKTAARTMLADAKLPVTFWAKAVNTACYVQNRVLVNKSQNKTPYELFNSRIPAIGFLRPFGYHVMILNTLDHFGKFDAKWDEGYFVGNSDAQDDSQNEQDCNADVPESSGIFNPTATLKVPSANQVEPAVSLTVEYDILTVSLPVPTVCLDNSPESSSGSRLISKRVFSQEEAPSLGNALTLLTRFEDTFEDTTNAVTLNRVEADLSNMETSIPVSPTPTFRIHKDHPKTSIPGSDNTCCSQDLDLLP